MLVVASIRSWDGTRILGVFDSQELAFECCAAAGFDINGEEFQLDIVEVNKISEVLSLVVGADKEVRNSIKVHIYSSESDDDS